MRELLDHAVKRNVTSFKRLKSEKYRELRAKYPDLPSHYVYTACQMAASIYRSFRKHKRRGKVRKERPRFRGSVLMLDDHLFRLDLERWEARISTPRGRLAFRLMHGDYHERFKSAKVGQAWIVRRGDEYYLKAVFRFDVELRELDGCILGVDVNENNVTVAWDSGAERVKTGERSIRTAYFLKRRRIQSALKAGETRERLLVKYRERERNRIADLYHKLALQIVERAIEIGASVVAMEDLKGIRRRIRYSRAMNGRLHRWSFRRFQQILEYKARLAGLNVIYVNPRGTSRRCPICGGKLSPNGHRRLKCPRCGFEGDRDVVGALNVMKRAREMWGASVPPEGPRVKPLAADGGRPSHHLI